MDARRLLAYLKVLPLLHHHHVKLGFDAIKQSTVDPSSFQDLVSAQVPFVQELVKALKTFYNYFESFWMKRLENGEYSWYRMEQSTDNPLESLHHTLNSLITKNPDPTSFIRN